MIDAHLIAMYSATLSKLSLEERAKQVRKLCRDGQGEFIKKNFPVFYKEAYPNG